MILGARNGILAESVLRCRWNKDNDGTQIVFRPTILRDRVRVTREAHILKLTVRLQSPATMKAVLEFDLDNRDDDLAHKRCVKSLDMALLLFDFINAKKELEYKLDGKELDKYEVLDIVYQKFFDLCEEYVINIDSLVE